jgi:RNA polymerase sigma-70 factor (ECF subfamily)
MAALHPRVAGISADDRLILSLLHLEGKPLEEIARLTGFSRVVVKVRAFRARKKLHAVLRRLEGNSM